MKIETKYNIGDIVYFGEADEDGIEILKGKVHRINIMIYNDDPTIEYRISTNLTDRPESEVFPTLEEAFAYFSQKMERG